MKIGLFFGSFNPIHTGHLIIAEFISQYTNVQQVWFVLSPQNPFKQQASLLNAYHRLHLVKVAIENNILLQASDVEFNLSIPSYTIDTLVFLQKKYINYQFKIILGSDSFQNIKRWKSSDLLLKSYQFIIYNRPGFEVKEFYNADYQIVDAPLLQISSTYVREQIKNKKSVRYLLPDTVLKEIVDNGYYK